MSVIFLNSHRAKSGLLNGKRLPPAYVLACKFFDCGIIDRTRTLEVGFEQKVLDEIPNTAANTHETFSDICDATARTIITEATDRGQKIQVLWSGGIDSTAALVALVNNIAEADRSRLEVVLSMDSINEYPLFFRQFILRELPFKVIQPPITDHFSDTGLIVTGEHGDQLFGSDKLLPLIVNQLAYEDYPTVLPIYLTNKFGNHRKVDALIEYLQPLIQACPHPIVTTFDLFWWLNFTIKWQQVSLRMPVFSFREDVHPLYSRFRHFFRNEDFQRWSLNNYQHRAAATLEDYKRPAKEYIYQYTKDEAFLQQKSKEPSLKNVLINRRKQGNERYRVMMEEDFRPVTEIFHQQYKNKNIAP